MIVSILTYIPVNSEGRQCLSEFDEIAAVRGYTGKGLLFHNSEMCLLGGSFRFDCNFDVGGL